MIVFYLKYTEVYIYPKSYFDETAISSLTQGVWYHVECTYNGTNAVSKLYQGDTLVATSTRTQTGSWSDDMIIAMVYDANKPFHIKNIKFKSL